MMTATASIVNQTVNSAASAHDQLVFAPSGDELHTDYQLHFGAKVAIALLVATVTLVAAATLAHSVHDEAKSKKDGARVRANGSPPGCRCSWQPQVGEFSYYSHASCQCHSSNRILRTCSVSSSSSSANSVASASAPILARAFSIKMDHMLPIYPPHLCDSAYWRTKSASPVESMASAASSADETESSRSTSAKPNARTRWLPGKRTLLHLFLSFSLQQSVSLIFQDSSSESRPSPSQSNKSATSLQDKTHSCPSDETKPQSIDSLHGLRFLSMIWVIVIHSYHFALRWLFFTNTSSLDNLYKTTASQLLANGTFACDSFFFVGGFLLVNCQRSTSEATIGARSTKEKTSFTLSSALGNIFHRYLRMMPLMMAIIGLCATLLRYLGDGPAWDGSTMMYDKWCRKNWWVNALFLHNFVNRENMCLSHSWYSAVDIQLFLLGQVLLLVLARKRKLGIFLCCFFILTSQLITGLLTLAHHLPAIPMVSSVNEQTMNLYYGEIYIKPYCRASPYLIGILQAYLMRTTSLGQIRLKRWQLAVGWTLSIGTYLMILFSMQPAMNGQAPSEIQSALYSALSRPLWACSTGWMIFACMTKQGGPIQYLLSAKCFGPLSRLTYPAFLIHPIVMAVFYGSRQSSFHFSHYLMLYLILGNIVITYANAFILSALFELPLLSAERVLKRAWRQQESGQ